MGVKRKPTWSTYKKGGEWWSIILYERAYDLTYETRGVKRVEFHTFAKHANAKAAFDAQVAAWLADGYVKLTPEELEALPRQGDGVSAYLGWTAPFPVDARYYQYNSVIHAVMKRDDVVITTGGVVGKNFGELERHYHDGGGLAAGEQFESSPNFYKPRTRAEVMKLYATAKTKTKKKRTTTTAKRRR